MSRQANQDQQRSRSLWLKDLVRTIIVHSMAILIEIDNISKEVFSLIGERMPPVVLQPETEKYQKKFKVTRKAQPW